MSERTIAELLIEADNAATAEWEITCLREIVARLQTGEIMVERLNPRIRSYSFPFLQIARHYRVSYADVLNATTRIARIKTPDFETGSMFPNLTGECLDDIFEEVRWQRLVSDGLVAFDAPMDRKLYREVQTKLPWLEKSSA